MRKEQVTRSLELKFLIEEAGDYKEEVRDMLDFFEAKIYKQMADHDRLVRNVITRVVNKVEQGRIREGDVFSETDREYRKEFAHWPEKGATGFEKGIRYIILEWRTR